MEPSEETSPRWIAWISLLQAAGAFAWLLALPGGISLIRLLLLLVPPVYAFGMWFLFHPRRPAAPLSAVALLPAAVRLSAAVRRFFRLAVAGRTWPFLLVLWGAVLLLSLLLTPDAEFGQLRYYAARLRPAAALALCGLCNGWLSARPQLRRISWRGVRLPLLGTLIVYSALILSRLIGIGWQADALWNEPAIPLRAAEPLWAAAVMLSFQALAPASFARQAIFRLRRADGLLMAVLWVITAAAWLSAPLYPTPFMAAEQPPAHELFPMSDAQTYDLDALSLTHGATLGIHGIADKPLYSLFLALLHTLFPQASYRQLSSIQLAVFAVLPALVYWLGGLLHRRSSALLAALLSACYGYHLLSTAGVLFSGSPRLFSTDFPALLALTMLMILAARWLQSPRETHRWIALGGCAGLFTLLRYNFWALLPLLWGLAWLREHKPTIQPAPVGDTSHRSTAIRRATRPLRDMLIVTAAFLCVLLPWQARSALRTGNASYFVDRFVQVVWYERFARQPEPSAQLPAATQQPPTPAPASTESESSAAPESAQKPLAPQSAATSDSGIVNGIGAALLAAANHTVHNLITPLFILPLTPLNHSAVNLTRSPALVWAAGLAAMPWHQWVFLALQLAVMAFGFRALRAGNKTASLLPLLFSIAYAVGLGAARTSGGRYILPLSMAPLLYWSAGIDHLLHLGDHPLPAPASSAQPSPNRKKLLLTILILTLAACSLIVFEGSINDPSARERRRELLDTLQTTLNTDASSVLLDEDTRRSIQQDLSENPRRLEYGWMLYPLFLDAGNPNPWGRAAYQPQPYPRLTFTLLRGARASFIELRAASVPDLPHDAEVLVRACGNAPELQAQYLLVFVNGQLDTVLASENMSDLLCVDE